MRVIRPCTRTKMAGNREVAMRHRWKNGICIHCRLTRARARVRACDCGCRIPILDETSITRLGRLVFVFGHETLDLFETHAELFAGSTETAG